MIIPDARDEAIWQPNPDFETNLIAYVGLPLLWPDGEVFGVLCALDTKENEFSKLYLELLEHFREVIELDLRMLLQQEELKQMNVRKELHIREVHHRIKNNFSLLIGIIQMRIDDFPRAETFLLDIESRIRAISKVHDNIYRAEDVTSLPLTTYIKDLAQSIVDNYYDGTVEVVVNGTDFSISSDHTMLIGLLINELTTNALKHAFVEQPKPKITISIEQESAELLSIVLCDNGVGLPENIDAQNTDSLGMTIVKSTVLEMNGSWQVNSDGGACFRFKLHYEA